MSPRAPFQVLIFPYRPTGGDYEYAIFQRSDNAYWQGIAGGGEGDETPIEAAKREATEEARVPPNSPFITLDSRGAIPVTAFPNTDWASDVFVVPEYTFGVLIDEAALTTSSEHLAFRWAAYEEAHEALRWDSNRTALWELHCRLTRSGRAPSAPSKERP